MRVKICGITRPEDARLAERLGADFVGLVFARRSKRRVDETTAKRIADTLSRAAPVGIFVEQTLAEVEATARRVGLRAVQLYRRTRRRLRGVETIQAIRVRDGRSLAALQSPIPTYHLLDAWHPSQTGGTGRSFDWSLLPDDLGRVFLAGGIRPENVRAAAALRPFGIDVSSGVESSPGVKDPARLEQLFSEILQ
jgi:phosphoribosylanthranilate isomerase